MREDDKLTCPRCGSSRTWSSYPLFGCHDCGYMWDIDEEDNDD